MSKPTTARPTPPDLSPGSPARLVLERASLLGLFDTDHLQPELSRHMRDKTLPVLVKLGWFKSLDTEGHLRAGRAGRAPDTYAFTEVGAQQAHQVGLTMAHAYHQTRRPNQAADILKLDVRLALARAGLSVATERQIIRAPRVVQPDNVATLPDGRKVLFEIEGPADGHQRPRILDKALHWDECAAALREAGADLQVRVIANVKDGPPFEDFCAEWATALAVAQQTLGRRSPIEFWAQPARAFAERPIWDRLDGFTRLDDPALVPEQFGPAAIMTEPRPVTALAESETLALLPPPLRRRVQLDEHALTSVAAHVIYFNDYLAREIPPLSEKFFELMRYLRGVAFPDTPDLSRLALPVAALFALSKYIAREPELKQSLTIAWRRYRGALAIKMALQLASDLIDVFTNFHGLRHDSPECDVWVQSPEQDGQGSRLTVRVGLNLPATMWGDLPERARDQVIRESEQGLAWVLQQLFDYPAILGIAGEKKKP